MPRYSPPSSRQPRAPTPLTRARLDALALAYAARFATSAGRLEGYLARKVAQAGWAVGDETVTGGEAAAAAREPIAAIVARFAAAGYIDDEAFARARAGGLTRRGFGARRIGETLAAAGIAPPLRAAVLPDEAAARAAALALARRRRFGPFGAGVADDPAKTRKQIAAMLRAGHPHSAARALVCARSIAEAEAWAREDF